MIKKLLFILFISIFLINPLSSQSLGGTIGAFQCSPSQPTTDDTIYVFADVQFSSSGCQVDNALHSVIGNSIMASAHHCLGMLSTICNTTDTFVILPLASGTYTFDLTLTSGFGGPPCTAGIIPDDNQNFQFTVSSAQSPCALTGASVYIDHNSNPWMMNATVNGMSQYSYAWTSGAAANQTPFYTQWCVTITDNITGCDTTICQDCIADSSAMCMCTMIYMPVCGCDGNMYSNSCLADCADVAWTPAISSGIPGGFLPCTQPNICEVEINGDSILCTLGSPIVLQASPSSTSSNFVSYYWTNGQSNNSVLTVTSPGIYCVVATDSTGCIDSACFTVSLNEIDIFSAPSPAIICDGDSIIFEIDPSYTNITWSTGDTTNRIVVSPITQTTYVVEATDISGCEARGEITVDIYSSSSLNISSAPSPPYICLGDSIVLEASAGFVSYSWNNGMNGDRIVDFPGQDTWYMVEAIDLNGCIVREDITVYVDTCVSSINNLLAKQIAIFPNPTTGKVTINLPENLQFDILLYEVTGKLINNWFKINNQFVIDEKISRGIYLLEIRNEDNTNYFQLIKR